MTPMAPATTSISQAFDIAESGVAESGYIAGLAFYDSIGQQVVRWNLDGSASRITGPGYAERALSNGSVFGTRGPSTVRSRRLPARADPGRGALPPFTERCWGCRELPAL
jgi:hypothetical protein